MNNNKINSLGIIDFFKKNMKVSSNKKSVFVLCVVILVIIITVFFWFFLVKKNENNIKQTNTVMSLCEKKATSKLYDDAATLLVTEKRSQLKDILPEITKQPGYKEDINCLYPLFVEALDRSDIQLSTEYFDLMKNANVAGGQYSVAYYKWTSNIEDAKKQLDAQIKLFEAYKSSEITF